MTAHLDADHHVEMPLAVLFYDVTHVIRLPSLLELPPRYKIFDFPYCSDGVFVRFSEAEKGHKA